LKERAFIRDKKKNGQMGLLSKGKLDKSTLHVTTLQLRQITVKDRTCYMPIKKDKKLSLKAVV
jgi:hypothetical protein